MKLVSVDIRKRIDTYGVNIIKKILKEKSILEVRTWLYHQQTSLAKVNILNGNTAFKEVQRVLFHQIDHNHFARAINDLCKLADIRRHPDAFYDANDYDLIPLKRVYYRFCQPSNIKH